MTIQKFNVSSIPGTYENRVFIGGNYESMPVLRQIEGYVREFEFTPILAHDCEMPKGELHDRTLLLLHSCKYAIFDVTRPSGELMELERVRDYGNVVLLVYQVKSPDEMLAIPGQISQMLTTIQLTRIGYHDFPTLRKHIQRFLMPMLLIPKFPRLAIRAVLGREPSSEEARIYKEALEAKQLTGYQLLTTILQSKEYQEWPSENRSNGAYVKNLYKFLLNREPREEELVRALSLLENHLTTKQQLLIDFIQIDEVCDEIEKAVKGVSQAQK